MFLTEDQKAIQAAAMRLATEVIGSRAAEVDRTEEYPCDNVKALTEPGSGSAATSMTTTAVKLGDKYVINGIKHWITGGGVSKTHPIFAQVVEAGKRLGIGGFIAVRGEDEGLKIGTREPAMGQRGIPETEVIFDNPVVDKTMALIPQTA